MSSLIVQLPYPPSVNRIWRQGQGQIRLSRHARRYRREACPMVMAEMLVGGHRTLTCRVYVRLDLYPPDRARRDVDNTTKAVLDVLQHAGAVGDDSQVDVLLVVRREIESPDGRVQLEMRPVTEEDYADVS